MALKLRLDPQAKRDLAEIRAFLLAHTLALRPQIGCETISASGSGGC